MIKIENLSKVFVTESIQTKALNNISFEIKSGAFVSIMGPSGCGKSTLLNIIGLLDDFNEGSYIILNEEMAKSTEAKRAKVRKDTIGFIFQNFNLIDELSVYDNIELPMIYAKVSKAERKKRVQEIAEKLNILHRLQHFPQQLSGGQQQRVAVARALVMNPKLILADEPTGNLDSTNGTEVMELLTNLHQQGTTILMVTHSAQDAAYSDTIITMKDGAILSEKQNQRNVNVFTHQK
ncbi:ABC transporter ATP-binding protein [Flavobacterium sp. xlx-214]|uniref:ABC transporter ATP-binding protein n=1 Tax=unclassified Flavobacterium TaxID=196869 RepID=UPI0013D0F393|nr:MULTISPECIES: ABC transporter ATP-binding protein [unclassified Flavobacterium]MBA5791761.1 ABC transporter ATP-binding protein [Flavobacterium sp. xlx-221]QMI83000.1 ABC transporter ATP-binding protein [Flavobacterium sp. xlx-214]